MFTERKVDIHLLAFRYPDYTHYKPNTTPEHCSGNKGICAYQLHRKYRTYLLPIKP